MRFLGRLMLYWCQNCNLPVLDEKCSCGATTKKIEITPPGDIRPAFKYDVGLINRTVEEQFGVPLIPDDKIAVLNKAPYDDRMDEVIFDGIIAGSLRFELEDKKWLFLPRLESAQKLFKNPIERMSGWVIIDKDAVGAISKGAGVLAPGVIDVHKEVREGDEVAVLSPDHEVISCGRARMSADRMLTHEKGLAVKPRWYGRAGNELPELKTGQTWDDAVEANMHVLTGIEDKARKFIKNVADTTNRPVTVSYSGGKDSLATLILVRDCIDDFQVLFSDTGLEFPETVENVQRITSDFGLPLVTASSGGVFWESFDNFGPPTVEARWCCKTCKLGPIVRLIEDNYENGCLTFIGQRKYESEVRANSEHIWKNPWVANQIAASPIQNWTALHVWLFLFWKKAAYNPLYEQGFDRIGCWLCPSSSLADLERIKKLHPELWARFDDKLSGYLKKSRLPREWIDLGLWRWQNLPPNLKKLAEKKGIDISPSVHAGPLEFRSVSGFRPCKSGGFSIEGSFGIPLNLTCIEESNMLAPIGKANSMEGVILVRHNADSAQVFASGAIVVRSDDEKNAYMLMDGVQKSVRRAINCTGCGVCVAICESRAIKVDGKATVTDKCTGCGKCISACPVVRFGPKEGSF